MTLTIHHQASSRASQKMRVLRVPESGEISRRARIAASPVRKNSPHQQENDRGGATKPARGRIGRCRRARPGCSPPFCGSFGGRTWALYCMGVRRDPGQDLDGCTTNRRPGPVSTATCRRFDGRALLTGRAQPAPLGGRRLLPSTCIPGSSADLPAVVSAGSGCCRRPPRSPCGVPGERVSSRSSPPSRIYRAQPARATRGDGARPGLRL